jgi:hypothetical protein
VDDHRVPDDAAEEVLDRVVSLGLEGSEPHRCRGGPAVRASIGIGVTHAQIERLADTLRAL